MEVVPHRHAVAVVHCRKAEPDGVLCPVHGIDRALERVVGIGHESPTGLGDVPPAAVEMPGIGIGNGVFHMVGVAVHVELGRRDGMVGIQVLASDERTRRVGKRQVEPDFTLTGERRQVNGMGIDA